MEIFFLALLLGLIPAAIAKNKGRSFIGWWIYGAALFIVALPHALVMKRDIEAIEQSEIQSGEMRKCPFCAELVRAEAKVCKHCHKDLPPQEAASFDPITGARII